MLGNLNALLGRDIPQTMPTSTLPGHDAKHVRQHVGPQSGRRRLVSTSVHAKGLRTRAVRNNVLLARGAKLRNQAAPHVNAPSTQLNNE